MGRNSIQVARVLGIRIGVDWSWFLVLFLFIVLVSGPFERTIDASDEVAYAMAVLSVLAFFASIALHELGHALMARRQGIEIIGIDLFLFGGVAKMRRDTDSPRAEFLVAIAGPLVTLLIALVCLGLALAVADVDRAVDAVELTQDDSVTPGLAVLGWLMLMNVALLAFNLIPAFPLDGGRVARALVWWRTGDRGRATRAAAWLGRAFSWLLIGLGVIWLASYGDFGGLWFIILGLFLGQAAKSAIVQSRLSERMEGVTVADIMDPSPVALPGDVPAARALDEWFARYRWDWFPLVDAGGRFTGIVREAAVREAVDGGEADRPVGALADAEPLERAVADDTTLETLLGSEALRREGSLMAVDDQGVLRGVVTIEQVSRALQAVVAPPQLES